MNMYTVADSHVERVCVFVCGVAVKSKSKMSISQLTRELLPSHANFGRHHPTPIQQNPTKYPTEGASSKVSPSWLEQSIQHYQISNYITTRCCSPVNYPSSFSFLKCSAVLLLPTVPPRQSGSEHNKCTLLRTSAWEEAPRPLIPTLELNANSQLTI